jgi:hypothetical protein
MPDYSTTGRDEASRQRRTRTFEGCDLHTLILLLCIVLYGGVAMRRASDGEFCWTSARSVHPAHAAYKLIALLITVIHLLTPRTSSDGEHALSSLLKRT